MYGLRLIVKQRMEENIKCFYKFAIATTSIPSSTSRMVCFSSNQAKNSRIPFATNAWNGKKPFDTCWKQRNWMIGYNNQSIKSKNATKLYEIQHTTFKTVNNLCRLTTCYAVARKFFKNISFFVPNPVSSIFISQNSMMYINQRNTLALSLWLPSCVPVSGVIYPTKILPCQIYSIKPILTNIITE